MIHDHPELQLSTESIQAVADAYTQGVHVDDICDDHDLTKDAFMDLRRLYGFRRGKPTLIESSGDPEQDVEAMTERHRMAYVEQKVRRRQRRELKQAAAKWQQFEEAVSEAERLVEERWASYSVPTISSVPQLDRAALTVNCQDIHVGKRTVDGSDNVEAAQVAFWKALDRARRQAVYDKAFVTIGADFYHVDNVDECTAAGTPQDMAMSVPDMLEAGQELIVWMIDQLRQLRSSEGPTEVHLVCTAGNHDRAFSWWLYTWLQAWYRNCPQVTFETGPESFLPRQYRVYGDVLMLFTHGDGAKAKDLGKLMSQEARKLWGVTTRSVVWTGHRHFEMLQDHTGVQVYQGLSSSGTDAWHYSSGYVKSRKGLQVHAIDAEDGVVATLTGVA